MVRSRDQQVGEASPAGNTHAKANQGLTKNRVT